MSKEITLPGGFNLVEADEGTYDVYVKDGSMERLVGWLGEEAAKAYIAAMRPVQAEAVDEYKRVLDEAEKAYRALVEEYCDYAVLNKLGDPEQQHNIKWARTVLAAIAELKTKESVE